MFGPVTISPVGIWSLSLGQVSYKDLTDDSKVYSVDKAPWTNVVTSASVVSLASWRIDFSALVSYFHKVT